MWECTQALAGPTHCKSIRLQVATEGERAALSPNGPAAPKTGTLRRAVQIFKFAQVERTFQQCVVVVVLLLLLVLVLAVAGFLVLVLAVAVVVVAGGGGGDGDGDGDCGVVVQWVVVMVVVVVVWWLRWLRCLRWLRWSWWSWWLGVVLS